MQGNPASPDYGIFEFHLDEKKIGESIDLYDPNVIRADDIDIPNVSVAKGRHLLKIKCVGKREQSRSYLFGIDYIEIMQSLH